MNSSGKVLILGASGGIGGEVARRLVADNWQVRALKRGAQIRDPEDGIQWIAGDALDGGQVAAAAAGCDVIVHAVNPPGYRHWRQQVLPMLRNTLQAAERQRALVVLPGTVYNYGPDAFPLIAEEAAQQPVTRKGAIRVAMELALKDYVQRGGRALIVRAGDFFGPRAGNNWFSQGLVKPGQLPRIISYPGAIGVGHQWAWLPDVAATIAALLARRRELEPFARFHMQGHWDPDGSEMSQAIQRVVARYGGEEFAVILFDATLQDAERVAARIQQALEAAAIPHPASTVSDSVTVSQGIACSEKGKTAEQTIADADAALYRAKEAGRNRWAR